MDITTSAAIELIKDVAISYGQDIIKEKISTLKTKKFGELVIIAAISVNFKIVSARHELLQLISDLSLKVKGEIEVDNIPFYEEVTFVPIPIYNTPDELFLDDEEEYAEPLIRRMVIFLMPRKSDSKLFDAIMKIYLKVADKLSSEAKTILEIRFYSDDKNSLYQLHKEIANTISPQFEPRIESLTGERGTVSYIQVLLKLEEINKLSMFSSIMGMESVRSKIKNMLKI